MKITRTSSIFFQNPAISIFKLFKNPAILLIHYFQNNPGNYDQIMFILQKQPINGLSVR